MVYICLFIYLFKKNLFGGYVLIQHCSFSLCITGTIIDECSFCESFPPLCFKHVHVKVSVVLLLGGFYGWGQAGWGCQTPDLNTEYHMNVTGRDLICLTFRMVFFVDIILCLQLVLLGLNANDVTIYSTHNAIWFLILGSQYNFLMIFFFLFNKMGLRSCDWKNVIISQA